MFLPTAAGCCVKVGYLLPEIKFDQGSDSLVKSVFTANFELQCVW